MAEIKMSYIFIEKQKHESKTLKEILLEIIGNTVEMQNDEILKIDNTDVQFHIIQKKNSEYCFLEMTSKDRVNRAIKALKTIDNALLNQDSRNIITVFEIMMGFQKVFVNVYTLNMQNLREN